MRYLNRAGQIFKICIVLHLPDVLAFRYFDNILIDDELKKNLIQTVHPGAERRMVALNPFVALYGDCGLQYGSPHYI